MPKTETQQAAPTFKLGVIPDQKKADALTKSVLAQTIAIRGEDSYIASWALVVRHDEVLKLLTKGDEEKGIIGFDSFVDGLNRMHKAAIALRKQFIDPVIDSKNRLLELRESWRREIEAKKKKEADEKAAELQKANAKQLEKDAKNLDREGEKEAAKVLREQAKTLPAPVVPPEPIKQQPGQVIRRFWDFTVEDYSKVPENFRLLDPTKDKEREIIDSKLNSVISKLGDKMPIPGVKIFQSEREHSRSTK